MRVRNIGTLAEGIVLEFFGRGWLQVDLGGRPDYWHCDEVELLSFPFMFC